MNNVINRALNLQTLRMNGRVTAIYGPRRVGKTTLVQTYLKSLSKKRVLSKTSDDINILSLFNSLDKSLLLDFVNGYDVVFIDEAQRIENIGISLKILIDARPELDIIVTGSASFDLLNKIGEPLTGRQVPVNLFPISIQELQTNLNSFEIKNNINEYLLYGMYPEVITANNSESKKFILDELVQGYLLKDALELEKVKSPKILHDLLKLLAFQIGKEVSHTELANSLKIDQKTVSRYIDILEKCFIIYNLRGFNRNLRSEVTKMSRYYFYDVGIRNSLINNFNSVDLRNDIGELWENFYFMERLKSIKYKQDFRNLYFWRTWEQNEIDLIEEVDGTLNAFEIKWNAKKRVKIPKLWQENYSANSTFTVITPENFLDFL